MLIRVYIKICFVAGTKVSTDKGFMPIEKIKPGDYVWSENPETNEKALKKVNKIFVREKDSIVRLSINGEVIETTDTHPFYVEGKGFVAAGSLNYGDEVRLQSGDTATVEAVEEIQLDEPIKVYNFEVEDYHTYYVSEHEVLVHNMCLPEKPFDYYMKLANNLDVSTAPNTATFYSGSGNRTLAENFAKANGKTTLEMTPGGKYLDELNLFGEGSPLTKKEATAVWSRLSERYAAGASGNVYAFIENSRPDSIFNLIEYPTLKRNKAVSNVFTELFKRGN